MNGFTKTLSGTELEKEIRRAINSFVDNNKGFTPYDVTQQIRKTVGPHVEVVHADVRPRVHYYMGPDKRYKTVTKDFNGNPATYFEPITNTPIVPYSGPPTIGSGNLTVSPPKRDDSLYMYPKSEGRVTVPASVLKRVGFNPYSRAWVSLTDNPGVIRITKNIPQKYTGDIFKLDKYGSFRLRKCYTEGFKRFKIVAGTDSVELVGE